MFIDETTTYVPVGKLTQEEIPNKSSLELSNRYREIVAEPIYLKESMPSSYENAFTSGQRISGFIISTLVIVGIAVLILSWRGHLTTLPYDLIHITITVKQCAIGGLVTLGLFGGAAIVIARAIHKNEELLVPSEEVDGFKLTTLDLAKAPKRGNFAYMSGHIETVVTHYRILDENGNLIDNYLEDAFIDTSTLDVGKNGKAFVYGYKDCTNHFMCSVIPFFGMPFVLLGTVVYNLFRAVIAPFYVLFQLIREGCGNKKLFEKERRFHVTDIGKIFIKSIWNVVKAPFYALAFMVANLYGLVNPMGGRKLVSMIERDWNEGVTLNEGFWSIGGKMPLFLNGWERGPVSLDKGFAYYLSGCQQPIAVVEYKNDKIVSCNSMEKVVDPSNEKWRSLNIFTLSELSEYKALLNEKGLIAENLRSRLHTELERLKKEKDKVVSNLKLKASEHNLLKKNTKKSERMNFKNQLIEIEESDTKLLNDIKLLDDAIKNIESEIEEYVED